MPSLKYMGSSHVHTLQKGDDFGGRLGTALKKDVVFNEENHWVVDTDEAGLSPEAVEILTTDADFKDVSGLEKIPLNMNQKIFKGMKEREEASVVGVSAASEEPSTPAGEEPSAEPGSPTPRRSR